MADITDPKELFLHNLGAALTMEQTVLEMLKTNEQKAQDAELKQQFSHHRQETEGQIRNLEQAFSALGSSPQTKPCPAIEGIQKEGQQMLKQVPEELLDAVVLKGAAETEHHEIAAYEGLIASAEAMGEQDVVALLQENLEQETHTRDEVRKHVERVAQQAAQLSGAR
jgi:ferritin-like metal-binding protein YciE